VTRATTVERLRVLWLIKGLGPGGAEQLLVNHAAVRDAERFDIQAAYLVPAKNHLVPRLEASGVRATCLHGGREWDLRWAFRLRSLIRRRRIEVVHAHSPYVAGITRLMLRTLKASARPALVYTEHNRWPRHGRATRTLNRLTMRFDDIDLAVSEDVRETMPAALARQVEVVEHGVEVEAVRAARQHRDQVREELGIAPTEIVIGTVANLRREKAYENLLAAAARALESDLPLRFVSVGQGPLEDEVHAQHRQLGLGDRFLLLGYRDDAVRVMSGFDIFTLSSRHEGLPVSLMDALALGLPVVATDVGGIPQAVTDGIEARLVPADDPRSLADAFVEVAGDAPRRAGMAARASTRAADFDISAAAHHLEKIYLDAASSRSR
jgi:glycosyltransferase involved in cell wall biosynthesis